MELQNYFRERGREFCLIFGCKQHEFLFNASCLTAVTHQMFDVLVFAFRCQNIERNVLGIASGLMMPFHTNGLHAR